MIKRLVSVAVVAVLVVAFCTVARYVTYVIKVQHQGDRYVLVGNAPNSALIPGSDRLTGTLAWNSGGCLAVELKGGTSVVLMPPQSTTLGSNGLISFPGLDRGGEGQRVVLTGGYVRLAAEDIPAEFPQQCRSDTVYAFWAIEEAR
ncbi:hypothetical protein [Salinibacterium sp. PAMC 21357]|uniref:hypothetical protein n=1 Tax=Salinibacterium sp. PAMC 21357 TaxID=1112215 RepID=UPI000289EDD6|nr:hypothetical protein [Salinibacterium sp. PAMC 21357]